MAIGTNDSILKFGTQDEVTVAAPGTVANGAFSASSDIVAWTNDDDAPRASAVLKCQFDTTMPTVGSIPLFARPINIQGTNDAPQPDANFQNYLVGIFPIDFGVAADTDFWTAIPEFQIPQMKASQEIEFYIKNEGTSQTIGTGWDLFITPIADGPRA